MTFEERAVGCLVGGCLGDAFGFPLEFSKMDSISATYGPAGPQEPATVATDDTQMTLFSGEAVVRHRLHGTSLREEAVRAYARWLDTQSLTSEPVTGQGWLRARPELCFGRGPGFTCLTALRTREPVADSKGCGTVMRVAPAGLAGLADPFEAGCVLSAVTHGHPTGIVAGGAMAWLVAALAAGADLRRAAGALAERLGQAQLGDGDETAAALREALGRFDAGALPTPVALGELGGGWCAESALAIGVWCALAHGDTLLGAVRSAAVHDGDSDSTAALAGQLVGVTLGAACLPSAWAARVDLADATRMMAVDLAAVRAGGAPEDAPSRYPT